ncbi:MAG: hypothetical protein WCQ49_02070 [Candidatus Saccharibacteria bacterium]
MDNMDDMNEDNKDDDNSKSVDHYSSIDDRDVSSKKDDKNSSPKKKSSVVKAILVGILIFALMGASAVGAYLWRDKIATEATKTQNTEIEGYKNNITALQAQLAGVPVVDDAEDQACTEISPSVDARDNIMASITSGNTAALEGYMAASVNVILAASESYGPQSSAEAVGSVTNFIGQDIAAWDYNFALSEATLTNYKDGDYSQYFPTFALVGKATNSKVISFSFDCNGKIDTVFLSASDSIL